MQTNPNPSLSSLFCNPNPNPFHHNSMQTLYFLRSLARVNHPSPMHRRRSIHRAAYTSMAYAAGPKMAWSRALLRRLKKPIRIRRISKNGLRKKTCMTSSKRGSREGELHRLVPGGRSMEFGSLLGETGHYIQCLSAQVRLMQSIADYIQKK